MLLWLTPAVEKFPRNFKFTLGDRTMATAIEALDHLIAATYSPNPPYIIALLTSAFALRGKVARRTSRRDGWGAMAHAFARDLRRTMTEAERRLWSAVRSKRLLGLKFRRQQPIGPFIVDFICVEILRQEATT